MKQNIIIFSIARSGTTAFTELVYEARPEYKQHSYMFQRNLEYLGCADKFFPFCPEQHLLEYTAETDKAFFAEDDIFLTNHYKQQNTTGKLRFYPELERNNIELKSSEFNSIFNSSFKTEEINRRISLLDDAAPYCFKYFDYHLADDSWINRDNTTVIVLYRKNILDRLLSNITQQISGVWHITDHKDVNVMPLTQKVGDDRVKYEVEQYAEFLERVDVLNPDIVITYEWLVEQNLYANSRFVKLNQHNVADEYENYDDALDKVSQLNFPPLKNEQKVIDLLT